MIVKSIIIAEATRSIIEEAKKFTLENKSASAKYLLIYTSVLLINCNETFSSVAFIMSISSRSNRQVGPNTCELSIRINKFSYINYRLNIYILVNYDTFKNLLIIFLASLIVNTLPCNLTWNNLEYIEFVNYYTRQLSFAIVKFFAIALSDTLIFQ